MTHQKKALLYFMSALYIGTGIFHLLHPEKYLQIMPEWLPAHTTLIYVSGFAEIALGILVVIPATRRIASMLIIAMLVVFLVLIHIPHTVDVYGTPGNAFIIHLIRTPLQLVFIAWAWMFAKKQNS